LHLDKLGNATLTLIQPATLPTIHGKTFNLWKFGPAMTQEFSKEVILRKSFASTMPVTRRAKHKANSLTAATKASVARATN